MEHPFTQFPKHLYHATEQAVIVHTAQEEAEARANGYQDEYVHQEYPKHVNGRVVNNASEEAALADPPRALTIPSGWKPVDPIGTDD